METIKRDLNRLLIGRKVLKITTNSPKQVQPSLAVVKKNIVGARIKKVQRQAKVIQIFLDNGRILMIHLKLTGRLLLRSKKAKADDWQRATIDLSGDKQLRLSDLRKFGWIKLIKNKKDLAKILSAFGPEPLDDLGLVQFKKILASSRRPIKVILLDQKKISGIGNIYACDALNLARINPQRPANKLDDQEAKKLLKAIEKVLLAGIKYRGASDQYYLDALGHKGAYQDHFLVYNREGKKCFNCSGRVEKLKLAGRGTYYCSECQK